MLSRDETLEMVKKIDQYNSTREKKEPYFLAHKKE